MEHQRLHEARTLANQTVLRYGILFLVTDLPANIKYSIRLLQVRVSIYRFGISAAAQ